MVKPTKIFRDNKQLSQFASKEARGSTGAASSSSANAPPPRSGAGGVLYANIPGAPSADYLKQQQHEAHDIIRKTQQDMGMGSG